MVNRTTTTQSVNQSRGFREWANAGFQADLLPVIPPGAALTPHTQLGEAHKGKTPGRMTPEGAWSGFAGWSTHEATADDISRWAGWPCNIGLQARNTPAVDIDVTEPQAAKALADLARHHLGDAPARTGREPKTLLPYTLVPGETVRKQRVEFTLPGDDATHAVEILGDGQFYVVEGGHPSGATYAWSGSHPADLGRDGLTPVTTHAVSEYLEAVKAHVHHLGGSVIAQAQGGSGADTAPADQDGLRGDPETIRDALRAMGNDFGYDTWITLVRACKAALGEENYAIYEEWCLRYPDNTPEVAREKWDSMHPPHRVGAQYIYDTAANMGWEGYAQAMGLEPVGAAPANPGRPQWGKPGDDEWDIGPVHEQWLSDYVWVEKQEYFFQISTGDFVTLANFARRFADANTSERAAKNPSYQFFQHPARRIAVDVTYRPGWPLFPIINGRRFVNMWQPSTDYLNGHSCMGKVTDLDVAPFLDHAKYLVPDKYERETLFDWMAFVLQHPEKKPNWAVFLGSDDQGVGKDSLIQPLVRGVGDVSQPGPEDLTSTHNEWVAEKKLVVVQEMMNFDRSGMVNNLKKYLTTPPYQIRVNKKNLRTYDTPNDVAFVFMSNDRDALRLDNSDRRYFVVWSEASPKDDAYYAALHDWMDARGGAELVIARKSHEGWCIGA